MKPVNREKELKREGFKKNTNKVHKPNNKLKRDNKSALKSTKKISTNSRSRNNRSTNKVKPKYKLAGAGIVAGTVIVGTAAYAATSNHQNNVITKSKSDASKYSASSSSEPTGTDQSSQSSKQNEAKHGSNYDKRTAKKLNDLLNDGKSSDGGEHEGESASIKELEHLVGGSNAGEAIGDNELDLLMKKADNALSNAKSGNYDGAEDDNIPKPAVNHPGKSSNNGSKTPEDVSTKDLVNSLHPIDIDKPDQVAKSESKPTITTTVTTETRPEHKESSSKSDDKVNNSSTTEVIESTYTSSDDKSADTSKNDKAPEKGTDSKDDKSKAEDKSQKDQDKDHQTSDDKDKQYGDQTDPSQGGTEQGGDQTDPSQGGTEQGGDQTDPSQGGTEQGSDQTDPSQGGTEQGGDQTDPSQGGTEQGGDQTDPSQGGTEQGSDQTDPSQGGTEQGGDQTDPSQGGTEQGGDQTDPSQSGIEQGGDQTDPGQGGTEQGGDQTDPSQGGTEQGGDQTDPSQSGIEQGGDQTDSSQSGADQGNDQNASTQQNESTQNTQQISSQTSGSTQQANNGNSQTKTQQNGSQQASSQQYSAPTIQSTGQTTANTTQANTTTQQNSANTTIVKKTSYTPSGSYVAPIKASTQSKTSTESKVDKGVAKTISLASKAFSLDSMHDVIKPSMTSSIYQDLKVTSSNGQTTTVEPSQVNFNQEGDFVLLGNVVAKNGLSIPIQKNVAVSKDAIVSKSDANGTATKNIELKPSNAVTGKSVSLLDNLVCQTSTGQTLANNLDAGVSFTNPGMYDVNFRVNDVNFNKKIQVSNPINNDLKVEKA